MLKTTSETNLIFTTTNLDLPYTYSSPDLPELMGQQHSQLRHKGRLGKRDIPNNDHSIPSSYFLSPVVSGESVVSYEGIDSKLYRGVYRDDNVRGSRRHEYGDYSIDTELQGQGLQGQSSSGTSGSNNTPDSTDPTEPLYERGTTATDPSFDYPDTQMADTDPNFAYADPPPTAKDPSFAYSENPITPVYTPIITDSANATHNHTVLDTSPIGSSDTPDLLEGFSPLLSLPLEILYRIIEIVYYDSNSISINSNLESFSKTIPLLSRKVFQLSLCFLYKYAIFNRPHSFEKFLTNLVKTPTIGKYVEYMDFQQFTSIGLGRTGRMNQEIQMVTSATIARALELTPNLIEFLASENIQDDMDSGVLSILFNSLPRIQALDFCGASSDNFARAFNELIIYPSEEPTLANLLKLSFHDCSNLTPDTFIKILPHLTNLRRLDLTHTSINSNILLTHLPTTIRLTHLSLARCSKLTTKDLINFLTQHPAVSQGSLTWLNLQIDSNVVSPLTDVYLLFILRHLNAPNLKYINLSGLPINNKILTMLKNKFTVLESVCIGHALVSMEELIVFLKDNTTIKSIDFTGIKPPFTRWNLTNFLQTIYSSTPSLVAIEYDYKLLYELTSSNGDHIKVTPLQQSFVVDLALVKPQIWKFYDNEGRRAWIYRVDESDPEYAKLVNSSSAKHTETSNLVYYDLETGAKIVNKVRKPDFLKYTSRKINCSIGYYNLQKAKLNTKGKYVEDTWPVEFSQRGIYNYYSLNVK